MVASYPGKGGQITLAAYPDCASLHQGRHRGTSVYVVGRHTEHERLFTRRQLAEASVYARETRTQVENVPTSSLCDDAVIQLLG